MAGQASPDRATRTRDEAVPVFLNARARSFRDGSQGLLLDSIAAACRAARLSVRPRLVAPDDVTRRVRAEAEAGASVVVVGGGDGSVRAAAQALVGRPTALGILPLGNRNHFARDLGIPRSIEDAVRVVAEGETRAVDVAELDGHVFVNNSALGFYPYLVRERERNEHRFGLGRLRAMAAASWRAFWRFPRVAVDVRSPEDIGRVHAPLVFVGNNEYATGVHGGTRSRLDRGMLYVCALRTRGRVGFLWLCVRSLFAAVPPPEQSLTLLVPELTIDLVRRRAWVSLDGEIRRARGRLRYRTRPRALHVLAPRSAGAEAGQAPA